MTAPTLKHLKTDLVEHYRWLRQHGCNDSHSGNASLRYEDTVWVTPTGCCADTLREDDLIACALDSAPPQGASLDAPLHLAVYKQNPQAACVLHSHGPHAVAMTLSGEDFTPLDFEGQYYFGTVPVINMAFDDYITKSPQQVAEKLSQRHITIVRGHGVYAVGTSINLAYKWSCSLELSAKTAWLARQI